jgi:hypothetical protein
VLDSAGFTAGAIRFPPSFTQAFFIRKTMKLRVQLKNGYQDWNVNRACRRLVKPIASKFGVTVEEFLRLYSRNELSNQPVVNRRTTRRPRIPRAGFDLHLGKGPLQKRLERAARFVEQPVAQFVWGAVIGSLICCEEDMIFCPLTGGVIGDSLELSRFQLGSLRQDLRKPTIAKKT